MSLAAAIIESTHEKSTEELAVVFFQYLRVKSGEYDENTLNRRKDLREKVIADTLKASKQAIPGASDEEWQKAINHLGPKLLS